MVQEFARTMDTRRLYIFLWMVESTIHLGPAHLDSHQLCRRCYYLRLPPSQKYKRRVQRFSVPYL